MFYIIVIPVYNSTKIISELCNKTIDAMNGFEFEVVLIDD